jgi:tetratricopeptide (TPR) repeat protein
VTGELQVNRVSRVRALLLALPLFTAGCADVAKAIVDNPVFSATIHDSRGIAYARNRQYLAARREFSAALAVRPDDLFAYQGRGGTYIETHDYDLAIRDANSGLRLVDPQKDRARKAGLLDLRALAYEVKGATKRASQDYEAAIAADPADTGAYLAAASAYDANRDYTRAIGDYSSAIKLRPYNPFLYVQRGFTYGQTGDQGRAISDYDQALRLDPHNANTLNDLCFSLTIQGRDLKRALGSCDDSLRLATGTFRFYPLSSRAFTYLKLTDYRRAISDADAALGISPRDADSRYLRAYPESKLGEKMQGDLDMRAALRINAGKAAEYRRYGLQ